MVTVNFVSVMPSVVIKPFGFLVTLSLLKTGTLTFRIIWCVRACARARLLVLVYSQQNISVA